MKRLLLALGLSLALAAPAFAQSDLTVQRFNCPGGNTQCFRVHTGTSSMSLTLSGDIIAAGGYKVAYTFAHPNYSVVGSSDVQAPIAGSGPATINATGPLYVIPGYAGSIISVSIVSNTAITATAVHAEAIRWDGTTGQATGLTAVIGSGLAQTTRATATQARGTDIFTASEGVGCRFTRTAGSTPTNAMIACIVTVVE